MPNEVSHTALRAVADADPAEILIAIGHVAERFGRTVTTIENWCKTPEMQFPRPKKIRRRRYFSSRELAEWEHRFSDSFAPRTAQAEATKAAPSSHTSMTA